MRLAGGFQPREKDPTKRFWGNVDKSDACWTWTAARSHGYGIYRWGGRNQHAHRIAYELLVGVIPEGLHLDHLCRNRGCVNPAHLEPVTARVNLLRGVGFSARNAIKTHCDHGHEFTPKNTYWWRGKRKCKECRYLIGARRSERNKRLRREVTQSAVCPECGSTFDYWRGPGGARAPVVCSDVCRLIRRRRQARDHQRRKRSGVR